MTAVDVTYGISVKGRSREFDFSRVNRAMRLRLHFDMSRCHPKVGRPYALFVAPIADRFRNVSSPRRVRAA